VSERSIIQVTLWNSPYLGNFMASQLALAAAAREQLGLRTHFVLGYGAGERTWLGELDAAGVTWSIVGLKRRLWRAHLDSVIREHSGALVHAHFTDADLIAAGAAAAAGVPCVWHIRTGFTGYPLRQRLTDPVKMRWIARRKVARIVAVAPWLRDLAARRGAPRERIDVLPNAADVQRFTELPDRAAARERFGLDADAKVILLLGWWPEVKGVDLLLDALAPIAERHPDMQALFVGEQRMRSFISERLPEQPPWLRLSEFVDDSAWLYAAADIFVSASRHEGQSGAIGEALASRLPVVMSDIPGSDVWMAAPWALGFPSEDVPALEQRLEQVLEASSPERAAAGAENREWVSGHMGMDNWSAQLCELYRALL
jgi:glycosyltransferase involved in cell wall biosynthesis